MSILFSNVFLVGVLVGFLLTSIFFVLYIRRLIEEKANLQAQKDSLQESLKESKNLFEHSSQTLQLQFEQLAARILEEKGVQWQRASKEDLTHVLSPLKHDLIRFQQRLDDVFLSNTKEQFALQKEIKRIVDVNQKMTLQTENLTKALKGDVRVQGLWGEVILERLLESSGLRKGEEYILQGADMKLKSAIHGGHMRPDVLIKLPDNRHIIIDAKVSLTAYEKLCQEEIEEGKKLEHTRAFVHSIKAHIQNLESKCYEALEELGTPEFVFMFMPIDGAYALALRYDPSLHELAWEKKIVLVAPSTLFATLRTVASLWRVERQNNNALDIARRGGMLYDKIAQLIDLFEDMGTQLERVQKSYASCVHKLSHERGNIVFQVEQLRDLGAKASRKISQRWCRQDEGESEESEDKEPLEPASLSSSSPPS